MNNHESDGKTVPPIPEATSNHDWQPPWSRTRAREWTQRLLAGNPFYLASGMLLLLGLNRVANNPLVADVEQAQLIFNFSALAVYELLLVFTAILLARRTIWYDSTLLVCLENMFVFVPFILISHATMLSREYAITFCLAAVLMTTGRAWLLKRGINELNLPRRLLLLGTLLLAMNLGMPLHFRQVIGLDSQAWTRLSPWCWFLLLPALQSLANFLPRPTHWSDLPPMKSWLPLFVFTLWMAVTAVHLSSLDYLDNHDFQLYLAAPLVLVMTWTFHNRSTDLCPAPAPFLRQALLGAPVVAPLLALGHTNLVLSLALFNTTAYAMICYRERTQRLAVHLLLFSLACVTASLPAGWFQPVIPAIEQAGRCWLLAGIWVLLLALRSRNPSLAVLAGIGTGMFIHIAGGRLPFGGGLAVQSAAVFVLLHSLRWEDGRHPGSRFVRWFVMLFWMSHSILWLRDEKNHATMIVMGFAVGVLGVYLLARLFTGRWGPAMLAGGAVAIQAYLPLRFVVHKISEAPPGIVEVAGSFVLFGLGTLLALNKQRRNRPGDAAPVMGKETTPINRT